MNESGKRGEEIACRFLEQKGMRLLMRNYHSRYGEIDIIAQDGIYTVCVEVKARGSGAISAPREAITASKQKKLLQTALLYQAEQGKELCLRFDVVEVFFPKEKERNYLVRHFPNAFEAKN